MKVTTEKVNHLLPVLIGPLSTMMEKRIQKMLMLAYEEGYKDGKESENKA